MPNEMNNGTVLFPDAPKCSTFVVEFMLAPEYESYIVRLMNGQPVLASGDFSSFVEYLETRRKVLLNDKRNNE